MGTKRINETYIMNNERRILRIFGPTKDRDGTWRIKMNDALNNGIRNKNIIFYIKAQRLSWFGHVDRMTNDRMDEWKLISLIFNYI
jgi:hypothetical protein